MNYETIHFQLEKTGQRLDALLTEALGDVSRAQIQQWIKDGLVKDAMGKPITQASLKLKNPLAVRVDRPIKKPFEPPQPESRPEALQIVFEDEFLLVVNKPVGLAVHPGAGRHNGTLVNLLLGHTDGKLSDMGDRERPGIVHRLDKDTSGLMVVAKTNQVHAKLADLLKKHEIKRVYQAVVWNIPQPRNGTIETQIGRDPKSRQRMAVLGTGGKTAVTHYTVLKQFGLDMALVECRLETGRTHQIRVHMAHIGCPLVGEPVYIGRTQRRVKKLSEAIETLIRSLPGQALHACALSFIHPMTDEDMYFEAERPAYLENLITALSGK